jgi:hypothetical protein
MTEDRSRDIAHHLLAKGDMERAQAYLSRGRHLQHMPLDDLRGLFVQRYRTWVDNLKDHDAHRDCDDLGVEFDLRGLPTPYELVEAEMQRFQAMVLAEMEKATPERMEEINREMVADYENATRHRN